MRLIDADRLLNPGYTDMFDEPIKFDMFSRYAIESEPTVEAIPIEYLKKLVGVYFDLGLDSIAKELKYIIWEWEKENETN